MRLHKEGTVSIILALIFGSFLVYLSTIFSEYFIIRLILQLGAVYVVWMVIYFFRKPHRTCSPVEGNIYSPVDGKVVAIERVFEDEYLKTECLQISVFMSPFNVHINWSPVSGIVKYFKYHPGKFLVAWHPKSSTLNERTTYVVENENGKPVLFRQIAGALARRIVHYKEEGDQLDACEEFGFIKFGSRVDVFIPVDAKVQVELDQKVQGRRSVLAEF
ncbi:phosphatidylserine decarboxylase family protein [bacterium SCSIO 12643]|nr:phosphatidylserine decarboxylase family protein [bacterium SCSIO 12643]